MDFPVVCMSYVMIAVKNTGPIPIADLLLVVLKQLLVVLSLLTIYY